jgi:hypothetical protein
LDLLLAKYYEDICETARIKSGLRHQTDGEKPSKHFSALLKQRSGKSAITSLTSLRNGVEVDLTEVEDILKKASSFLCYTVFSQTHKC